MSGPYVRNCFTYATSLMRQFSALAIIGARQVGKTTLAKQLAPDFFYIDLEKPSEYDRFVRDPEFFFKQHQTHIIFDEAQLCPPLFAVLRGVIDEQPKIKGRFIITGSSSPMLLENISESLAGRIAIIELGTLKANERVRRPLSDFYQLFSSEKRGAIAASSKRVQQEKLLKTLGIESKPLSFKIIQQAWLQGGYPEPVLSTSQTYYHEWMVQYELTYVQRDIARLFPLLDKITYRRFLTMLGKLSGNIINKSALARALHVSEPTVARYLEIAQGTFLWRQLPSFENNITKSIVKMPKGFIRDSGLLHHLLRISSLESLYMDPIVGGSFEAFVIEELLKGLQDSGIRQVEAYYYRTRGGSEIDLIIEGDFGLLPIEIKYGSTILGRQLRGLTEFISAQKLPFGIVINQSDQAQWLTPNILQVPVGYL